MAFLELKIPPVIVVGMAVLGNKKAVTRTAFFTCSANL